VSSVALLCPARCRYPSNSVPTCTYASEPLLEVAGFEPTQAQVCTPRSGVLYAL
jgi:hypothetical protein